MTHDRARKLAEQAEDLGFRHLRIQKLRPGDTGWGLFGIHPGGHNRRIDEQDLADRRAHLAAETATERA